MCLVHPDGPSVAFYYPLFFLSCFDPQYLSAIKYLQYNLKIIMKTISFVWDGINAESNLKKHKISFEEAQTVFSDPNARMIIDPEHSEDEDRFILLGISSGLRLLVVCHCLLHKRQRTDAYSLFNLQPQISFQLILRCR